MHAGGHIVSPEGRPLSWTDADATWLLRAVEAEGPPRDWVAQALVNRWSVLQDASPGTYPTLAAFVRAYSQPVNPRWFPGGDLLEASIARAPAAEQAQLRARAETRRDTHSRRAEFSDATRSAVARALEGPITLPAGVTDFAMDSAQSRASHGTPYRSEPGENAFWKRHPGALYSVAPSGPSHPAGAALRSAGVHAGFGVVVLLGLLATPFVVSGRASRKLRRRA